MRFVSYIIGGETRLGIVHDGYCVDANLAYAALLRDEGKAHARAVADAVAPPDALAFIASGDEAVKAASAALSFVADIGPNSFIASHERVVIPLADVELRPPVPRPGKVICVGRNFKAHAEEAGLELAEYPIMFPKFSSTLVGAGQPIVAPSVSHELDWEGELAVVIGKPCHRTPKNAAMSAVFGYTLFNDVTVRDYQFRSTQYTAGKNFDTSGPLGPYLVLPDELPDPHDVDLTTTVNEVVKQEGNTKDFLFDIPTMIEIISEWITLEPGDVIAMGTPAGVGFKRKPPEFLKPGDVVRVTGSGPLGSLENPVVGDGRGS